MTDAAKPVALIALAAIVACGGAGESDPAFHVRGTGIVIQSDASFTRRSDFPARVESTIEAALRYWGGSWSHLDGRTVTSVRVAGSQDAYAARVFLLATDAPAVRRVVREARSRDFRFSSFILAIVNSTPFQMRRSS